MKSNSHSWARRFAATALLFFAGVITSAQANPWVFEAMRKEMPYGFERVTLPGSTFDLRRDERKELHIPYGPRALSKLFFNANTQGCALGDIEISAVNRENGAKRFEIQAVPEWPQWYYLKFDEGEVRKIVVSHHCGSHLHVQVVQVDLGPHAVDYAFRPLPWDDGRIDFRPSYEQNPIGESTFDFRKDLALEILRHMPDDEGRWYYLVECLDRLLDRMGASFARGDASYADFANPLSELIEDVKVGTVVEGGSFPTLEALRRLRIQMVRSEPFLKPFTNTPDKKAWPFAYRTIGKLIDDKAKFYFRPEDFQPVGNAIPPAPRKRAGFMLPAPTEEGEVLPPLKQGT